MLLLSQTPLRRLSALVLGLCYIWLSLLGSFLHDCGRPNAPAAPSHAVVSQQKSAQVTHESHIVAHEDSKHTCSVCAWQAVNVTPALPAFEIVSSFACQQRVVTTFPRYLKTVVLFSSSRAPPLA